MHHNQTATGTEHGWRTQIEADLETGARPVFDLGLTNAPHRGLHSLLALYTIANARIDVTAPIFLIGGNDSRWLAALFYPDTFARAPRSPHLQILFAGADIATYVATFAAFSHSQRAKPVLDPEISYGAHTFNQMIAGAANRIFANGIQTGDIVDWASLPIVEMTTEPRPSVDPQNSSADSISDWLAWTVLLFAVALLLLAVIV